MRKSWKATVMFGSICWLKELYIVVVRSGEGTKRMREGTTGGMQGREARRRKEVNRKENKRI